MNLTFAVERLYETGWAAHVGTELDTLPDGRSFPSVRAIEQEFAAAGLDLTIKHNLMFSCYRASWRPTGEDAPAPDMPDATVIGTCPREAAVYALAQLRTAKAEQSLIAM